MRIKRTKHNCGSGGGRTIFESKLFHVTEWHLNKGIQTVINCDSELMDYLELRFNGKQNFTSDNLCMEQLNMTEILRIIKHQKKQSFEEGKEYKINQIRECLEMKPTY